jgi:hypothetical protein
MGVEPTQGGGGGDDSGGEEEEQCSCQPASHGAAVCADNGCPNFALQIECPLGRCVPGCRNQRLQRKERAKVHRLLFCHFLKFDNRLLRVFHITKRDFPFAVDG